MGIRDFLARLREKKGKYKEFEEDMKVQETYLERKKSANERELERFQHDEREKVIKQHLEKYRDEAKEEAEFGHQILAVPNVYKNEKQIILKQKNLFSNKSNLNERGGLFFK